MCSEDFHRAAVITSSNAFAGVPGRRQRWNMRTHEGMGTGGDPRPGSHSKQGRLETPPGAGSPWRGPQPVCRGAKSTGPRGRSVNWKGLPQPESQAGSTTPSTNPSALPPPHRL